MPLTSDYYAVLYSLSSIFTWLACQFINTRIRIHFFASFCYCVLFHSFSKTNNNKNRYSFRIAFYTHLLPHFFSVFLNTLCTAHTIKRMKQTYKYFHIGVYVHCAHVRVFVYITSTLQKFISFIFTQNAAYRICIPILQHCCL